ncbi:MAG: DUF4249 domain-containing protein [Bacteroidetes bacterium]|nr:DUF4249 domain-containing protein [Bacteroidota bacterium]
MRISFILFLFILVSDACVERINIDAPKALSDQLVIEGLITDEPGPYTVKLSRATNVNETLVRTRPVSAVKVVISDNLGNSETLKEIEIGTFQTDTNGIQGVIGRSYTLHVETNDGKVYESTPETIVPAGTIENIRFKFETSQPENNTTQYGFRFFIDAKGDAQTNNLLRWKFSGIYKVVTYPEQHTEPMGEGRVPAPRACSGYVYDKTAGLAKVGPCTCCECWTSAVDSQIKLSDNQTIVAEEFRDIEVGFLSISYWTYEKTLVEIKQMSLSQSAFDYWKTIKDQKDGASSLFQPSIGKARTNIFVKNGSDEVQGLFYASAIATKSVFITPSDLPQGLKLSFDAPPPITESCIQAFKNSTTKKPYDWE